MMKHAASAFTLIEIIVASLAASILLLGIYGIFHRAMKIRDDATERVRDSRIRQRGIAMIRNDLANAYISGGVLACTLEGGVQNQKSRFPGYIRFTASTGKDTNDDQGYGDVQQIEYYISGSNANSTMQNGPLVRVLTRDLLGSGSNSENLEEEPVLPRAEQLDISFYDGQNWQDSWQITGTTSASGSTTVISSGSSTTLTGTSSLPRAVRFRVIQSPASANAPVPPPIEIFIPFGTEPFVSATSSTTSGT